MNGLHEEAATIIVEAAKERELACRGQGQSWACPDCKHRDQCEAEHAHMVRVAVKLRAA